MSEDLWRKGAYVKQCRKIVKNIQCVCAKQCLTPRKCLHELLAVQEMKKHLTLTCFVGGWGGEKNPIQNEVGSQRTERH